MSDLIVFQLIKTYLAETTTNEQSEGVLDKIVSTLKRARLALNAKLATKPDDSDKENEPIIELVAVESFESVPEIKQEQQNEQINDEPQRKKRKRQSRQQQAVGELQEMPDLPRLEEPHLTTVIKVEESQKRRRDGTRGLTFTCQSSFGICSCTTHYGKRGWLRCNKFNNPWKCPFRVKVEHQTDTDKFNASNWTILRQSTHPHSQLCLATQNTQT